jgi:GTPase SAR1 family protein
MNQTLTNNNHKLTKSMNKNSYKQIPQFKVIMVGDSGVGKTCIVIRAAKNKF